VGLRHQLAVYSPVRAVDLAAAVTGLLGIRDDAAAVDALLRGEYGADRAVLVDSGTHALQLALTLALTSKPSGTPVALPAFSCFDVATAAIAVGAP